MKLSSVPLQAALPLRPLPGGKPPQDQVDRAMPKEFQLELDKLGRWAEGNKKDARNDRVAFWVLKVPAILVSASAAALAHFGFDNFAMIASAGATGCVLIDGLRPRGQLLSAHIRATHEISTLQSAMVSRWHKGILSGREPRPLAAEIIEWAEPESARIAAYLTQVESSLQERPPMA